LLTTLLILVASTRHVLLTSHVSLRLARRPSTESSAVIPSEGLRCQLERRGKRMYSISDAALALKNANKSNKHPGPEKVVLALCPLIEKTTQPHPSGNGTMVTYQIRRCPRMDACSMLILGHTDRGRIKFQDKAAFSTPQKHILSCTFGNDIEHMLDAYWELQVGLKKQALLGNYLHPSVGASMLSVSSAFKQKRSCVV
jgi:hypothetical protein